LYVCKNKPTGRKNYGSALKVLTISGSANEYRERWKTGDQILVTGKGG